MKQDEFINLFKNRFREHFGTDPTWLQGQVQENRAGFTDPRGERRRGKVFPTETFELGDLRADFNHYTIVLEYDYNAVGLENLLKHWAYARGELEEKPKNTIILCHFSSWHSNACRRDLWEWIVSMIHKDDRLMVNFEAKQFDHGGEDTSLRNDEIKKALGWIERCIAEA